MEILNNIWNVLMTENSKLTSIITAPTVLIESIIIFNLFTIILKISYTKTQKIAYIIIFSIITLITEFIIPSPYNFFINYFVLFIVTKIIFNLGIIKTLVAIIIPTITFALVGNLILNPFLTFFHITYQQTEQIPFYRILYMFTIYTLFFIVIALVKYKRIKFNFIDNLSLHNRQIILLNLIIGSITLSIQLFVTFYYINIYSIFFTLLNFISLGAYFFISFYSLTKTMKLQVTTTELESAENYNNTLTYLYDNVKAFKHDFDNIVFIMGGYIDQNDINGLKDYYKHLEKDCERVNNIALLSPELINNSGIYNLLMSKYKKAHEVRVDIKLEFFFDLTKLHMPIYDFSRMLGILLDNAIEAASESAEKQVHILFRDSSRNHTQIVKIENTYQNKDINTSEIFEKGKTTKENHTGMGLWEVNQILKRNNNVKLDTTTDDIYFKQSLEIYY